MPTQEQITINERRKYLKRMLPRYRLADPTERSRLLTEMHAVTTLERKSLIRLLNSPTLEHQPRQRQRSITYDHPFDDALRILAQILDYVCAERLQPTLLNLAQHLDGAPPPRTPPASPAPFAACTSNARTKHRTRHSHAVHPLGRSPTWTLRDRLGASRQRHRRWRLCLHPANGGRGNGLERTRRRFRSQRAMEHDRPRRDLIPQSSLPEER